MKINFDVKYRPQIESGEYKVETRGGNPIRILALDLPSDFPIATAEFTKDNRVIVESYSVDGWVGYGEKENNLFIVTPEEELTEFEKAIKRAFICAGCSSVYNGIVKDTASELLALAREELFANDTVLKEYAEVAREQGKAEALKNLPRWNESRGVYSDGWIYEGFLYYKNHSIQLSSLEKLPGFKED